MQGYEFGQKMQREEEKALADIAAKQLETEIKGAGFQEWKGPTQATARENVAKLIGLSAQSKAIPTQSVVDWMTANPDQVGALTQLIKDAEMADTRRKGLVAAGQLEREPTVQRMAGTALTAAEGLQPGAIDIARGVQETQRANVELQRAAREIDAGVASEIADLRRQGFQATDYDGYRSLMQKYAAAGDARKAALVQQQIDARTPQWLYNAATSMSINDLNRILGGSGFSIQQVGNNVVVMKGGRPVDQAPLTADGLLSMLENQIGGFKAWSAGFQRREGAAPRIQTPAGGGVGVPTPAQTVAKPAPAAAARTSTATPTAVTPVSTMIQAVPPAPQAAPPPALGTVVGASASEALRNLSADDLYSLLIMLGGGTAQPAAPPSNVVTGRIQQR
jgi:hypothetical protein